MMYIVLFLINLFWAGVIVYAIQWFNTQEIGLFYWIEVPFLAKLFIGIAMYDLSTYWFHRTAHFLPLVWRFHRVHHSDTTMDSSTFLRSHSLELMLWFSVSDILASAIFGLDLTILGLYYIILIPMFFLEHANLKYPKWLDKTVGLFITTPNIHKVHHEQDEFYTNSNYVDMECLPLM
ncbi:MAG: sterol desaturase family protein [Flavobacteriaceae bacterium]|nr:sterol desaturase family protein [Flavobacteriaceae bacterium]